MALFEDDEKSDGFSFIWTIQNFSYCVHKTEEYITSPCFTLNIGNNLETFWLELYPRGYDDSDKLRIWITRKEDNDCEVFPEESVLSVRTVRGSYKKISDLEVKLSAIRTWFSLLRQDIFKKGTDVYLDNDALTIRWRIFKVGDKILESEQCYALTTVNVERVIYTWNLKTLSDLNANELESKKPISQSEITSFTVNVSVTKVMLSEDKFEITIKRANADKLYFSTCEISLLDTEKVLHYAKNEHWFERSDCDQIWRISFAPKTNFPTNSKQNYLRCEFVASCGVECSKIEKTVYGSIVGRPLMISKPATDSDILGSWKDNLRCFYSEGKISDFTIRIPRKEFPVHKAMLCAQSPVFCAMFERDMKENRTGIVEIEDLEDDTVSMMLLYVYTCSVENLDWEKASKLYFAADKYELTALKDKCSVFLKENLTTTNTCKLLILADTHQDEDLKSVAQDFIVEYSSDIINSDEWKKLIIEKVHLAAETMQVMLVRNLKV